MSTVKNVLINVKSNTKGIKDLQTEFDKLTKDNKQLAAQYKKTNATLNKNMKESTSNAKGMSDAFDNIGMAVVGAFTVGSIIEFGRQVLEVTAEFQKLEAVLTNTLGSNSKAQLAMMQLQKFAAETPFSVVELTNSFVKLTNQGFKPTMNEMTKLGDLASSTGKTFDDLAEAIIDGQVGEMERLKEFGIRAQKEGDKVIFTFKGVKTEVDRTEKAMRAYIVGLGDVKGVSGSMAAISKTLGGQISNLGDAWDMMLASVGGQTEGVFSTAVSAMANTVTEIEQLLLGMDKLAEKSEMVFADELQTKVIGNINQLVKSGADHNDLIETQIANLNREKILLENKSSLSQKQVDDMSVLEVATDGMNKTFESQIHNNDVLQAQNEGKIIAIEKFIVLLKKQGFVTDELNKLALAGNKDKKEVETDLIKIQQALLKIAKETPATTEAATIARRQKIEAINEEIKRLKGLRTEKEKQEDLDLKLHNLHVEGAHERTQATIEAEKALDKFNKQQKLTAGVATDAQLALKDEIDVVLDLGEAVDEVALKEQNQMDAKLAWQNTLRESIQLTADTAVRLHQQQLDKNETADMKAIQNKLDRNQISEMEFDRRRKAIQRKKFEQEKMAALFQIQINGAIAVSAVWAEHGGNPPLAGALSALVGAQTLASTALVLNEPMPEFEKGGEIGGKRHREGGTHIVAEDGEFVINRTSYGKNTGAVKAINDGNFDKYVHEHYVLPALKLGSASQNNQQLADNIAESIMLHTKLDDQRIVGHLKMNNDTSKDNARALIDALGSSRKDLRNV